MKTAAGLDVLYRKLLSSLFLGVHLSNLSELVNLRLGSFCHGRPDCLYLEFANENNTIQNFSVLRFNVEYCLEGCNYSLRLA